MIKETGNINKSLFTNNATYGLSRVYNLNIRGKSKTMMIACISPSIAYFDETLSTI